MAFESTWRQQEVRSGRALIALAAAGLLLLLPLVPAVMFLWPHPSEPAPHLVDVGLLEDIPLRTPVFVADGDFWLVRLDDQHVLALSTFDSHLRHCRVPWRPGFHFNLGGQGDEAGWFRDPCSGSTYDLVGNKIYGPSPRGLDRYEVRIQRGLPGNGPRVQVIADAEHLAPGVSRLPYDYVPVRP